LSATIKDVAEASGVSSATVSYVINNGPRAVRPATRERVQRAIRALNYHPNAMARSLVRRYTNTLGVLFANESVAGMSYYSSSILSGIMSGARAAGYSLTLFTHSGHSVANAEVPFRDGRSDGVVVICPPETSSLLETISDLGLPLVAVASPFGDYDVSFVDVDNVLGVRLAMEHLLSLGHTKIASLIGPPNQAGVRLRHEAFKDCIEAAGLSLPAEYSIVSSNDPNHNYATIRNALASPNRPTAIFCGNDDVALIVMVAARDLGLSVPDDVSVVGFDDIPAAFHTSPQLTTVRQPLDQIGAAAATLLINRLGDHLLPVSNVLMEPTLIVRNSTAPPSR
jgi:DNA-binding LacI/PurR family transcriptional regulator